MNTTFHCSRRVPFCPLRSLFIVFPRRHNIDGHCHSHSVPPSLSSSSPFHALSLHGDSASKRSFFGGIHTWDSGSQMGICA